MNRQRRRGGGDDDQRKIEPAIIAGRVPPHDLDAEAAVLSAILLDHSMLDRVLEILDPEHFYSDANGRILDAMIAVSRMPEGKVDIVTVGSYLRDRDRIAQIGGATYLAQLADATPAVAHVTAHAKIVFQKWRLRRLIATCQRIAAEGYGEVEDPQSFIDAAEQSIYEIARNEKSEDTLVHIGGLVRESYNATVKAAESGKPVVGIQTGIERFDAMTSGLQAGDLTIVAARPGIGKTSLVLNWGVTIASHKNVTVTYPDKTTAEVTEHGRGVVIFSLEMPKVQLVSRMICSEARVDLGAYRNAHLRDEQWRETTDAMRYLETLPIWIDDRPAVNLTYVRGKVRRLQAEFNRAATETDPGRSIGLVIIDYLQLMTAAEGSKSQNREQEISEISRGLKQLSKELGVPVVALSQLNRGVESRQDKHPMLSDLRESGAIEQDADVILFIYRDEYYNPDTSTAKGIAELIIAKQRNGPPGKVLTRFTSSCTRFDNLSLADYPDMPEAE